MSRTLLAGIPFLGNCLFRLHLTQISSLQRHYSSVINKAKGRHPQKASQLETKRPSKPRPLTDWTIEEQHRIHISGSGSEAKFFICTLAQLSAADRPLITLLVQKSIIFHKIAERNRRIFFADGAYSSIVDGFDVELLPLPRKSGEKLGRGWRFIRFNTMRYGPEHEVQVVPVGGTFRSQYWNYEAIASTYEGLSRIRQDLHDGYRHLPTVDELSKPRFEIAVPRSQEREPGKTDLHAVNCEQAATEAPLIKNLIVTSKPEYVPDFLRSIQHRLRWDSTILFLQKGMGLIERLNDQVFRDASARPTYIIGSSAHFVWSEGTRSDFAWTDFGAYIEELRNKRFEHSWSHEEPNLQSVAREYMTLSTTGNGILKIGPIVHDVHSETVEQVRQREEPALYLRNILQLTTSLGTRYVSREYMLIYRLKKTIADYIYQTLGAIYEVRNRDIFKNEDAVKIAKRMLREAVGVVTHFCPGLTYDDLETRLIRTVMIQGDSYSSMLADVSHGISLSIDHDCGFMVELGKRFNIKLPIHEAMIYQIKKKRDQAEKRIGEALERKKQEDRGEVF
jgi:ketopantoate reductase